MQRRLEEGMVYQVRGRATVVNLSTQVHVSPAT